MVDRPGAGAGHTQHVTAGATGKAQLQGNLSNEGICALQQCFSMENSVSLMIEILALFVSKADTLQYTELTGGHTNAHVCYGTSMVL